MFLIHCVCLCRLQTLVWIRRNCYPRFCTEKPLTKLVFFFTILITSFSQYTTICFVSFLYSVFNEHFCELLFAGGDDGIRSQRGLRALVAVGSNSPPDCYSLPPLFESRKTRTSKVRFWLIPYLMVEMMGFEPMTPCLQGRCSPNWATPP